jgi:DNA polymerase III subunit chi
MAEIRFYTLGDTGAPPRLKQVCALIEKAFRDGERVLVWLDDAEALTQFDNLLWTFGDRSFVPHEPLAENPAACEAPVQLHAGADLPAAARSHFTTLVMLREQASKAALDFRTVIEVVDADPAIRAAGRARFRFYRDHGATPQHLELKSN